MSAATTLLDEPLVGLASVCLLMDLCHPEPDGSVLGLVMDKLVGDLEAWHWSRTFARLESPHGPLNLPFSGQHLVPKEEVVMLASVHRSARQRDPYWRNLAQQLLATSVHPAIRTLTQQMLATASH